MRVEFYLTSDMEISHLAPIVRELRQRGTDAVFVSDRRDVVPLPDRSGIPQFGYYDADRAEALLDSQNLPFVGYSDPDADLALTIQSPEFLGAYRKRKARVMYGVGLVAPDIRHREAGGGFDFYLVPGQFSRLTQFRYHGLPSVTLPQDQVRRIGYPRFDAHFKRAVAEIRTDRTILYLPSWSDRSSIDRLVGPLSLLCKRFVVSAKPHHLTPLREPDRVAGLRTAGIEVIDSTHPPESFLAAADLVIADLSSGAYTEAILAKKKVLGIATSAEYQRLLVPTVGRLPMCFPGDDLADAVDRALEFDWPQERVRHLRAYLFDTSEGSDAARAADAIVEACEDAERRDHT